MNNFLLRTMLLLTFISGTGSAQALPDNGVTVFAAASLTDALTEIGRSYEAKTNVPVRFSFAASSALARQIEMAGGADIFMSADADWLKYLSERDLIHIASQKDLLGNRLVLIAPRDSTSTLRIAPGFALAEALGEGRLSMGDPYSVPAGKYARTALTSLGVWSELAEKLVRADSVRLALTYVARKEAPFGIVYETDALVEPKVRIVDTFSDSTHFPIIYPVALTKDAKPEARAFLDYLEGAPEALVIYRKYGFRFLPKD
jgi:molybdate transport system substrate-binding protein